MEALIATILLPVLAWIAISASASASASNGIAAGQLQACPLPGLLMTCPATFFDATHSHHVVLPYENPLLFHGSAVFPPFHAIRASHVVPGMRALLRRLEYMIWVRAGNQSYCPTDFMPLSGPKKEGLLLIHLTPTDVIEHSKEIDLIKLEENLKPTWPDLVEPLEMIVDQLIVSWGVVGHLKAVKDSNELRAAIEIVQPEMVEFQLKLSQSRAIYESFKMMHEDSLFKTFTEAHQRIIEGALIEAEINGVGLEGDAKSRFNEILQDLVKLSTKFSEHVLDSTNQFQKLITNKEDIAGLPVTALGLAAQAAAAKGHVNANPDDGPWLITLDIPSYLPVMLHVRNRSLREEIYRAFVTRASSGDLDNTPIINKILELRLEKAKLLGYENHAQVSMVMKMATLEKAEKLLEDLRTTSWDSVLKDFEDLKAFAKEQGAPEGENMCLWDISFWNERFREANYNINEEELRPFFSLPRVIDGLFALVNTLFGIIIEAADGLAPVWHEDVRFYQVKDITGEVIAYFYLDPYSRPAEKRSGAWMAEAIGRSRLLAPTGSHARLPVAHVVCNQTPPLGTKPSLMTFWEVETIFHEFGHALHHMLTKQDEGLVSGIRGVEVDAVELPSQFMENWCYHRETLLGIAKHYETGESLSEDVYQKLLRARTFRAASHTLRQIHFASIDLELHSKYMPGGKETIFDLEQRVSEKTHIVKPLPEDRFLCTFEHIFAGGYDAGYYSYKWAEVLSADAFSAFEEVGLDNEKSVKETGQRFRETILAVGGGRSPLQVFVDFRGREPSINALLRHSGLLRVSM